MSTLIPSYQFDRLVSSPNSPTSRTINNPGDQPHSSSFLISLYATKHAMHTPCQNKFLNNTSDLSRRRFALILDQNSALCRVSMHTVRLLGSASAAVQHINIYLYIRDMTKARKPCIRAIFGAMSILSAIAVRSVEILFNSRFRILL